MGTINNGERPWLAMSGVHNGEAGAQVGPSGSGAGAVTVVFRPNIGTAKPKVGAIASLAGEAMIVQVVEPSPIPGFVQILLAPAPDGGA